MTAKISAFSLRKARTTRARIALTDGDGWFDSATALCWDEDTWFDGHNQISHATGSQWEHESLYYTKTGRWVLCQYSQYQDQPTTYVMIDAAKAVNWLIRNDEGESELIAKLPDNVRLAIETQVQEAEI